MLRYFFISFFLAVVATIAIFGFQGQHFKDPPIQIFPDMKAQPKYVAQHESDFFADGRDERPIVPGTVPIGYIMPKTNGHSGEYASTTASNSPIATGENGFSDSTSYFDTGKIGDSYGDGLPDEVKKDIPALLARGQQRFNINCAVCHGAVGMGNGIVTQFGLVGPANFQQAQYRTMPDGQIFNTITFGKGKMGAYGPNIAVEDRWAIVAYIRALQRSQNATQADAAGVNLDQQTPAKP
ncbi:MAG TPA: cytochrome c [Chthoniobacteraceae bacterium]|nr:cytochrome c [Chthoniobacteraceae bacterium]